MASINDAFPSQYLKASDLKGRTIAVTIDRIDFEPVGQKKEMKPILYFEGKEKGLVLNKTNATKIASMLESDETEDWAGCEIALYPTETSYQGEQVDCIRVKPVPRNGNARKQAAPPPAPVVQEHDIDALTDDDIPF